MKNTSHSSGFTLVEIAIVLTIIGVMLGSGILALTGALNDIRYRTSRDRISSISNALALFVQQNYSLPCPATPPLDNGSTTGTPRATCTGVNATGIVPYAVLGLTSEQARDSYGNFITYTVNPSFATEATVQSAASVHDMCRSAIWVVAGVNRNPRKARFCCNIQAPGNILQVQDSVAGNNLAPGVRVTAPNGTTNTVAAATNTNPQTAVFVLVSHGKNGWGAYRNSTTPARYMAPPAVGYRPNEEENGDDDTQFIASEYSSNTTGTNYFDDIVMWRTQDQLIGAFGRDSCARP